jgi:hypothetical protein
MKKGKKVKETTKTNESLKQTEIIVVLDRSGSMGSISQPTVDGFNTFLNEQKNAEGEAFITLIQFDDRYEVNYKSVPVKDAPMLVNGETYVPRGTTALYESVGKTINEIETDRDVVFVIITDGHDNVRSEFKPEAIKKMITTLQDESGWKFIFLAANQDAFKEGDKLGMKKSQSMSYAASAGSAGISNTFFSVSANLTSYRSGKADLVAQMGVQGLQGAQGFQGVQGLSSTLDFTDNQRAEAMDDKSSKAKDSK